MSLSHTIGAVAASNPAVGVAVARQSVSSAILSGLQGDATAAPLLAAFSGQAEEVNHLMAALQPHLGQNVNLTA